MARRTKPRTKPPKWVKLWLSDLHGSSARSRLSGQAWLLYVGLLAEQPQVSRLPADPTALALHMRLDPAWALPLIEEIRGWLDEDDGGLYSQRMDAEIRSAQAAGEVASKRARAAASSRWDDAPSNAPSNTRGNAPSNAEPEPEVLPPLPPAERGVAASGCAAGEQPGVAERPPPDPAQAYQAAIQAASPEARPQLTSRASRRALRDLAEPEAEVVETLAWIYGGQYRPPDTPRAPDLRTLLLTGAGLAKHYPRARLAYADAHQARAGPSAGATAEGPSPWDCPSCGHSPRSGAGKTVSRDLCEPHGRGRQTRAVTCESCGHEYTYRLGRPCLQCATDAQRRKRESAGGVS